MDTVLLTYPAFGQTALAILTSLLDTYRAHSLELDTCKEKEKKKKARVSMANVVLVIKRWLKLDWMLLEDPGNTRTLSFFLSLTSDQPIPQTFCRR